MYLTLFHKTVPLFPCFVKHLALATPQATAGRQFVLVFWSEVLKKVTSSGEIKSLEGLFKLEDEVRDT